MGQLVTIKCAACGAPVGEFDAGMQPPPTPCPHCGSTARTYGVALEATVTLRSMLRFKARHPGGGRPFGEGEVGDDVHRKTGRWMRLERIIDRARDWYREHISDPTTGEVVRHVEEPLSQHRDHGSAKRPDKSDV